MFPQRLAPAVTLRAELESELLQLSGLTRRPSRYGHSHAYYVAEREVAHFHGDGRVDVRLTKERIRELRAAGALDPRVRTRGTSAEWVAVALTEPNDLPLIRELVEDAVRQNG